MTTNQPLNLAAPPRFFEDLTRFAGEAVVGFRALTEPNPDEPGRVKVAGYQLVTDRGIYEFTLDGICVRASALHRTSPDRGEAQ